VALAETPTPVDEPAVAEASPATGGDVMVWLADAEKELKKIPFFVRGKARRNTEKFAAERGVTEISVDTLYEAKAHFAR
jgi:light-independent protochlorophyllide reductase subunit B